MDEKQWNGSADRRRLFVLMFVFYSLLAAFQREFAFGAALSAIFWLLDALLNHVP